MKTISFVIPVYNEQERLHRTFEAFSELQLPRGLKLEKIIFVDDGSTDKTLSIIRSKILSIKKELRKKTEVISYKNHQGKGYAVNQGMFASDSDYTLFCDADMSTSLSELDKFVSDINKGVPIIIGTRKNGESTVTIHQPVYRELLGRGFTKLSNAILQTDITDFTCGFKAFSRQAKDEIFSISIINGWGFDVECMYLAKQIGFRIREIPVRWEDKVGSKVKLLRDLPKSLFDLLQIKLNSHYPQLFQSRQVNSSIV